MKPFTQHTGIVGTLDRVNVDTDQIIPKQFLKRIERSGFEDALFFDWRFLPDGAPNPEFELNQPRFAGASILLTRAFSMYFQPNCSRLVTRTSFFSARDFVCQ